MLPKHQHSPYFKLYKSVLDQRSPYDNLAPSKVSKRPEAPYPYLRYKPTLRYKPSLGYEPSPFSRSKR